MAILSWAPHNGGHTTSSCVFNHQLGKFDEKDLDSIFKNVTASLGLPEQVGTINLVLACNALPDLSGKIEAVHVATMAKARALSDLGIKSEKSGLPATGTGTDCILIVGTGELNENYCGIHTVLGELIGKVVHRVITEAITGNGSE